MWENLGFRNLGFWGLGRFIMFLLISFSRFQYFNLHFGSLIHWSAKLVLGTQNTSALTFFVLVRDAKIDLFTHFRLFPIIMWHISKIKPRFVQYAKIIKKVKT